MTQHEAIDTKALRALAEKATPGPWHWYQNTRILAQIHDLDHRGTRVLETTVALSDEDADYIAVTDPDTVLALLDDRDGLRRALIIIEDACEHARKDDGTVDTKYVLDVAINALKGATPSEEAWRECKEEKRELWEDNERLRLRYLALAKPVKETLAYHDKQSSYEANWEVVADVMADSLRKALEAGEGEG